MSNTLFLSGDTRDREAIAVQMIGVERIVYTPDAPEGSDNDFDIATRGMYVLASEAAKAGVKHIILLSTMAFFSRIPQNWHLDNRWRPNPSPELSDLCPFLRERSLQEVARAAGLHVTVLRLGTGVDAKSAIEEALAEMSAPWRVRHVGDWAGRPETDNGRPWRELLGAIEPVASRPIRKVVLLGAGGPIGRTIADELMDKYTLRLADIAPLAEAKPQSLDAPVARPLPAPHEEVRLDIRDFGSVLAACEGCDAIINLAVVRHDPIEAFLVNALGSYNIAKAAARLNIRRVVQTAPQVITLHGEGDFAADFNLPCDAPARPGRHLYGHSKFLGNETLRVFAEWYGLEVSCLLFSGLAQPDAINPNGTYAFMTSWQDAARVVRCALEAPNLPTPYEEFHCFADFPHQQSRNEKAERILGWKPQDKLEGLWRR
jgi:nucleoside-diphosphate-sugar epimerase